MSLNQKKSCDEIEEIINNKDINSRNKDIFYLLKDQFFSKDDFQDEGNTFTQYILLHRKLVQEELGLIYLTSLLCQTYRYSSLDQQKEIINLFKTFGCYERDINTLNDFWYDDVLNYLFHYSRDNDLVQQWIFSIIEKNPNKDVKLKFFNKMISNDSGFSKNIAKKYTIYITLLADEDIKNVEDKIINQWMCNLKNTSIEEIVMIDNVIEECIRRGYTQEYFQNLIFVYNNDLQNYLCSKLNKHNIFIQVIDAEDYPF